MSRLVWVTGLAISCAAAAAAAGAAPVTRGTGAPAGVGARAAAEAAPLGVAAAVDERVKAAFAKADAGRFPESLEEAKGVFNAVAAYGTAADLGAFVDAAYALRVLTHLQRVEPAAARAELYAYLRAHDEVARTLAFAVEPADDIKAAYALFDRLRRERAGQVERLPALAAAVCVVHDKPLARRVNENTAKAADPVAIFDYFVEHERQMFYGLRNVPVDLLVYVVDTTASVADMNWALQKYGGTRDVGRLFFSVDYDEDAFRKGTAKKVTSAGYTLPNILKYGGVCADQAYFAASVGKAIGVPATYTRGQSADISHAWVGFLQLSPDGRRAAWNFDSGRYEAYKGVRGNVTDPQTGRTVADGYVSLLADAIGAPPQAMRAAVAVTDAARLLRGYMVSGQPLPVPDLSAGVTTGRAARGTAAQDVLEMAELALRQYQSHLPAWEVVADVAGRGRMTAEQKLRWADLVQRFAGQRNPDFAVAMIGPMIDSVEDPAEQSRLLDALFSTVQARPDLASMVRLRQAAVWEKKGDLTRAGQCYEDVLRRYVNAGPAAVDAVRKAEEVLRKSGQDARVLALYQQAVTSVKKPAQQMAPEFLKQSNWYRLREAYAEKLAAAGRKQEAETIRAQAGVAAGKK